MIINTEEQQYVVITLEEYKTLLMVYAQYLLMTQPVKKDKEPQKEKIGFK